MEAVASAAPGITPLRAWVAAAAFAALGVAVLVAAPLEARLLPLGVAGLGLLTVVVAEDLATRRARNVLVIPGTVLLLLLAFVGGVGPGLASAAGCAVAFGVLLVIALVGAGRMGMGDVKFGAMCGAGVGVAGLMVMLAAAFLVGGALAAVLLVARVRGRHDTVAFTPFLAIGVLAAWLVKGGPG